MCHAKRSSLIGWESRGALERAPGPPGGEKFGILEPCMTYNGVKIELRGPSGGGPEYMSPLYLKIIRHCSFLSVIQVLQIGCF
jgi:hypothetical protein